MINLLLDILLPQEQCCLCHKSGRFSSRQPWCQACTDRMMEKKTALAHCDRCGKYLEENGETICLDCREKNPAFAIARSVGPYEDCYRIAVKLLKFMGRANLARQMGTMMAKVIKEEARFWPLDLIVPVPISPRHLKQRKFNQTELLARQISREIKVRMDPTVLNRVKETPSQRELTKVERERNLIHAFIIKDKDKVKQKNILLVDDVYTTGSTVRECTRVLLEAGAKRVAVITWAAGKGS